MERKPLTYFLLLIILGLGVGAPPEEKRNTSVAGEIKLYTLLRARQTPPGEKPDFICWKNSSFPVSANCKILLICAGINPLFVAFLVFASFSFFFFFYFVPLFFSFLSFFLCCQFLFSFYLFPFFLYVVMLIQSLKKSIANGRYGRKGGGKYREEGDGDGTFDADGLGRVPSYSRSQDLRYHCVPPIPS